MNVLNAGKKFTEAAVGKKYLTSKLGQYKEQYNGMIGKGPEPRTPYDQSLYGILADPALRRLPPILRLQAKRYIDIYGAYYGTQQIKKGLTKVGNKIKAGINKKLQKLSKKDKKKKAPVPKVMYRRDSSGYHLEMNPDELNSDSEVGSVGFKVTMVRGDKDDSGVNTADKLSEAHCKGKSLAEQERDNSLKFRPREDTLWFITIDRYTKSDGNHYPTVLPPMPVFDNKYNEKNDPIKYINWIPATGYRYTRRNVSSAAQLDYGWGGNFKQISTITRGTNFSISLEDDVEHSWSKWAKEVINRSANYERSSITYWECLICRIKIVILNKQWEVQEKFTLLGLLVSDGATEYSDNMGGNLKLDFEIVGEVESSKRRLLEEYTGVVPKPKPPRNKVTKVPRKSKVKPKRRIPKKVKKRRK